MYRWPLLCCAPQISYRSAKAIPYILIHALSTSQHTAGALLALSRNVLPTASEASDHGLQALVGHCEAWRANFTGLLNSIALKELQALHDYFQTNMAALRQPPTNLDMLAEAVQLHKKLSHERPAIQARFEPLNEKYRTLEKFEVRPLALMSKHTLAHPVRKVNLLSNGWLSAAGTVMLACQCGIVTCRSTSRGMRKLISGI